MKPRSFAWLGLSLALVACGHGTFRDVHGASELAPNERLLFGEVLAEGAPLSNYALGVYLGTEVVFDRVLPDHELTASEMDSLGEGVGERLDRNGGPFVVAAPTSEVYVLGVRVRGTEFVRTVRFLATPARISAGGTQCSYVGSIVIRPAPAGLDIEVRDDLPGALSRSPDKVKGCELTRALAARVDDSVMVHVELPHSSPPVVGPVDLQEHSASYPLRGKTVQALRSGIRNGGLSGDVAALTEARLSVNYLCRQYSDGFALEKATVHLDLTVTLPDWQDREDAPAGLQKRWEPFASALKIHEDGHRQIAKEHAEGFRAALAQIAPGTSCEALQDAAKRISDDWSDRMSAAQTAYDRVTRHGIKQGTVL